MSNSPDVIVIGGGPAGYVAAIRAAQNGLKTVCIDAWKNYDGSHAFGGTCLNAGCIPSKALLESSELLHRAQEEFGRHGIRLAGVDVDLGAMQARKAGIVRQLTAGIEQLFEANGVTGLRGHGRLLADRRVEFTPFEGEQEILEAANVILAAGSVPVELAVAPFDGTRVVDSWGALEFEEVPQRLGVIGGGVIGLELGSVWRRLGAEVTVLEALEDFLFMADRQIAREAQRHFKKLGMDILLGAKVTGIDVTEDGVDVRYEGKQGEQSLTVDKLIVAVGRRPCSEDVLSDESGVELDERGYVKVDEQCRTGIAGVWAIGDLVRGPMLAHKASEEGVMVADLIAGRYGHVNYAAVPAIVYTAPEIAWVGKNEEEVKAAGTPYKVGTFSFGANGRAKALEQAAGLVKIIAAEDDDRILGVHICGPMAGELLAEAVLALEFDASAEDLQRTIHGHPTLSEVVHEAALAVDKRALHAVNR